MPKALRFLLWMALLAGVVVGVARMTAIRWWRVPSDDPYLEASLSPTLRGGDLVLLWRLTAPVTGDLVVCPEPKTPERVVVARIAGIAGETVTVDGAQLLLNHRRASTEGNCRQPRFTVMDPTTQLPAEQVCSREQLGGNWHERGETFGTRPPKVVQLVGDGQVFLLSDNRQFPWDSREFGPAERASCKEMVLFRIVSAKGFGDAASRLMLID